jgi:hypothetical protein
MKTDKIKYQLRESIIINVFYENITISLKIDSIVRQNLLFNTQFIFETAIESKNGLMRKIYEY